MANSNSIIGHISNYTIGNLIVKVSGFLLIPMYSVYLSTGDYGIINSMTLFGNVLFIIITLSLDRAIYRIYFDYTDENNKKIFLGTITISMIAISTMFVLIMFVLNKQVSLIFRSIPFYPYYAISITTTYVMILYTIAKIFLQVTEQSKKFITLSITYFTLDLVFTIIFVAIFKKGAVGKLYATLVASVILIPVTVKIVWNNILLKYKWQMFTSAVKYSLPVIPTLLSAWILNLSDRIFIERYYSLEEVGIYSMGYKLADIILLISTGFFTAYSPLFFKTAIKISDSDKKNILIPINNQFILLLIILSFSALLIGKDVVTIILHPKYYESYIIFRLINIGYLFHIAFSLVNSSFAQEKKMITMMIINLGLAGINISLNFILIPKYGMYGAAYATIISYALFGIVKYFFARQYYFIVWQWRIIIKYVVIVSFGYVIGEYLSGDILIISLLIKLSIILLISGYYWYDNRLTLFAIKNHEY
jgi:O-antigen/teichoic acid export membrane protein